jgi:hypothetical protein|tara:strand:- start:623 stop:1045 length:423 start_codon:yes stop_codon:yes gene_type:complete
LRTDARGRFWLDDIAAGSLTFSTRAEPILRVANVELEAVSEHHLEGVIDIGCTWLEGQVLNAAGYPVAGLRLRLRTVAGSGEAAPARSLRTTVTGAEGRFVFEGLGSVKHELTVRDPRWRAPRISTAHDATWAQVSVTEG